MIALENLQFSYPDSQFQLTIDSLAFEDGERVAIVGPSGCGKTTLLNLVAGIESPDSGKIEVLGQRVDQMNDAQRRQFRVRQVGMVFQEFELLEYLSALDNILVPYAIHGNRDGAASARRRATELAKAAGIEDKLKRGSRQLSRGEQQRVAICRALIANPGVVLADEPTGNLDPHSKDLILDLLFAQCAARQLTLLVVTHDHALLPRFDRAIDFEALRFSAPPGSGKESTWAP